MVAGLIALLALPFAALAADEAGWEERLARAVAMQAESKARQSAAKQLLEQKNLDCATKFFVNSCRNDAYQEHLQSLHDARRLENDGKALERAVKKEQMADREKRQAAALPQREAERQERQAETAASRQAADEKAAANHADKLKRAAEGERRQAAAAEKQRRKQADHDARLVEKKQQAARQAQSQSERQAEHQAAKAAANQ